MFQFFKKKSVPAGPHEFCAEVEIDRPASEVYPLLDFADPRNAKRELGDSVEAIAGQPGRFDLVVEVLPEAVFALQVTCEKRGKEYAFSCVSDPLFGRVVSSHERYQLEDHGEQACRLILTNTIHFDGELSAEALEMESMMLNFANSSALAKLKLHAEEGADAVRAYERAQYGWLDDLDCDPD